MTQQPKKWIADEIQSLDPHTDYVRIWQLSSSYGSNEFIQNMVYALTFPNFIVTEWGSEAVWREDGGKVVERSSSRVEQTQNANALWWWYGPHDERTKKSVDGINRLHAYWAEKHPGCFSHNDDYVYVNAFTAVNMHRLRLTMGLPGIGEKEKIAAHKFWGEMCKLFVSEGGVPLHGYPDDFDGLIRFCEAFETMAKPKPERANLIGSAIYEQFVFRFFPKDLHWLGHQLIRSLALPTTLETLQIDPPYPMAKYVLPKLMGLVFWHQEMFEDDPERSYVEEREGLAPDERKAMRDKMHGLDKAFPAHFSAVYKDDPRFAGCPFHTALARPEGEVTGEPSAPLREIESTVAGNVGLLTKD